MSNSVHPDIIGHIKAIMKRLDAMEEFIKNTVKDVDELDNAYSDIEARIHELECPTPGDN